MTLAFRTIVRDVPQAQAFYTTHFGFVPVEVFEAIAILERDGVRLWLAGPKASASRPLPDGRRPEPGGWNRIAITVDDIAAKVAELRAAGVVFRNDVITGPGGSQVLIEDPSGNPVELFEPRRG